MFKFIEAVKSQIQQLLWGILIFALCLSISNSAIADDQQEAIKSIIQTREIALQAINTMDFSKLEPYLHPSFTITTVDNRIFHNAKEFEQYWQQQLSNSIKNITLSLKGDTVRTFLSPETETAYGDATATFDFKDGNVNTMAMRWTAVMQKFQTKWTIQSIHFSANLLDNPVLKGAQQLGITMSIGSGVLGLILGGGSIWLWSRKNLTRLT